MFPMFAVTGVSASLDPDGGGQVGIMPEEPRASAEKRMSAEILHCNGEGRGWSSKSGSGSIAAQDSEVLNYLPNVLWDFAM